MKKLSDMEKGRIAIGFLPFLGALLIKVFNINIGDTTNSVIPHGVTWMHVLGFIITGAVVGFYTYKMDMKNEFNGLVWTVLLILGCMLTFGFSNL